LENLSVAPICPYIYTFYFVFLLHRFIDDIIRTLDGNETNNTINTDEPFVQTDAHVNVIKRLEKAGK
jgi:hypothetical protein